MSRSLGIVEWNNGKRAYFVYDHTVGASFRELYESADAARAANEQHLIDSQYGLAQSDVEVGQNIAVVRVAVGQGWDVVAAELGWEYGLATTSWLLSSPVDRADEPYGLLLIDGIIHLSTEVDSGFQGRYEAPICDERIDWDVSWRELLLLDWFSRPLRVCEKCLPKRRDPHAHTPDP